MIPPLQFGGDGRLIHFLHANGYPPESYRRFLSYFVPDHQVIASYLRSLWPGSDPAGVEDWRIFRDDLLRALDDPHHLGVDPGLIKHQGEKLIGVGHSIGGTVTLMAALKATERFYALVLIEPVIFPPWLGFAFSLLSKLGLLDGVYPLIQRTLKRRRVFDSEGDMFKNYREKGVFKGISDEVLWDYVRGLARSRHDGRVELAYPPEWEAKIYQTGGMADPLIWDSLAECTLPVLLIRGEKTDTLRMKAVRKMSDQLHGLKFINMREVGHLVPLEAPGRVFEHVRAFLDDL